MCLCTLINQCKQALIQSFACFFLRAQILLFSMNFSIDSVKRTVKFAIKSREKSAGLLRIVNLNYMMYMTIIAKQPRHLVTCAMHNTMIITFKHSLVAYHIFGKFTNFDSSFSSYLLVSFWL